LTAIDCGASPGGWTKFLSLDFDCETVYSVDPGQLDPSVAKLPGVVHLPIKAETAIQQFAEQGVRLDIWVSDMCLHDMNQQIDSLKDAIGAGIVRKNALF
jgi:23S rRNA C2498 (ribose-2'-O)-methylase RlmM